VLVNKVAALVKFDQCALYAEGTMREACDCPPRTDPLEQTKDNLACACQSLCRLQESSDDGHVKEHSKLRRRILVVLIRIVAFHSYRSTHRSF
jgi:hypothetical protein